MYSRQGPFSLSDPGHTVLWVWSLFISCHFRRLRHWEDGGREWGTGRN